MIGQLRRLNHDPQIDAILVQEPLPSQLNNEQIINVITPQKDVDGLHPLNLGKLYANQQDIRYPIACTPSGVVAMLDYYHVELNGANVVIVGRSKLVGKPLLALLNNRNATVTLVGHHTRNFSTVTSQADILIVAAGPPHLIKAGDVKKGAVVIDVGINRLASGKLVGDVDYQLVSPKVRLITPVSGGVGPMTIASLMKQIINLACWRKQLA